MKYWLGLGANIGDRLDSLRRAADAIAAHGSILGRSRIFAASPVGGPPQPPFLNAALAIESALAPLVLLSELQRIESALGRDRSTEVRWGPRTMDIDILLAGNRGEVIVDEPDLVIPHVLLADRAFALAGLLDLDDTIVHPKLTRPLKTLFQHACSGKDAVAPTGDRL